MSKIFFFFDKFQKYLPENDKKQEARLQLYVPVLLSVSGDLFSEKVFKEKTLRMNKSLSIRCGV